MFNTKLTRNIVSQYTCFVNQDKKLSKKYDTHSGLLENSFEFIYNKYYIKLIFIIR